VHCPAVQERPPVQGLPQLPQLTASVSVSTHLPPQKFCIVPGVGVQAQEPFVQV
jgi:hypothetical protein